MRSRHGCPIRCSALVFALAITILARSQAPQGTSEVDALRERVQTLERLVQRLDGERSAAKNEESERATELERLRAEVANLKANAGSEESSEAALARSIEEAAARTPQVLARPWYQNLSLSGVAAVGFLGTGSAGQAPGKGFVVGETTLFLDTEIWGDESLFIELNAIWPGFDDFSVLRTEEIYLHLRNVCKGGCGNFASLKIGRFDLPFGEEYLQRHANENPFIVPSASYPWAFDEGVLGYGRWCGIGWAASITDGSAARSIDDDPDKALTAKVWGRPFTGLYLSASGMRNGATALSPMWLAESLLQPVPPATKLSDVWLYEGDARWECGERNYVRAAFGQAFLDQRGGNDPLLSWATLETRWDVCPRLYLAGRLSSIWTRDDGDGYQFGGYPVSHGDVDFGFLTHRFTRLSLCLGWLPNPRTIVKFEVGHDWFDLVEGAGIDTHNGARWYLGVQAVVTF
jgi:hypothetical protein